MTILDYRLNKKERAREALVKPLSIKSIRQLANYARQQFLLPGGMVDMRVVLEKVMPRIFGDGYYFSVLPRDIMGSCEGRTYYKDGVIALREDVYADLCRGGERARFTAAHELGHFLLHTDDAILSRSSEGFEVFRDAGWQADTFAAEFLVPFDEVVNMMDPAQINTFFGVSFDSAEIRVRRVKKELQEKGFAQTNPF